MWQVHKKMENQSTAAVLNRPFLSSFRWSIVQFSVAQHIQPCHIHVLSCRENVQSWRSLAKKCRWIVGSLSNLVPNRTHSVIIHRVLSAMPPWQELIRIRFQICPNMDPDCYSRWFALVCHDISWNQGTPVVPMRVQWLTWAMPKLPSKNNTTEPQER